MTFRVDVGFKADQSRDEIWVKGFAYPVALTHASDLFANLPNVIRSWHKKDGGMELWVDTMHGTLVALEGDVLLEIPHAFTHQDDLLLLPQQLAQLLLGEEKYGKLFPTPVGTVAGAESESDHQPDDQQMVLISDDTQLGEEQHMSSG